MPRNVPDSILKRLPKNGGVVMMTFVPQFTSQPVVDYGVREAAVRDSLAKVRALCGERGLVGEQSGHGGSSGTQELAAIGGHARLPVRGEMNYVE